METYFFQPPADLGVPTGLRRPQLRTRLRETLECLLAGYSEKEAAAALRLSRHTVHAYVKELYEEFGVTTRAELMAWFVPPLRGARLLAWIESRQQLNCPFERPAPGGAWDHGRGAVNVNGAVPLSEGVGRGT